MRETLDALTERVAIVTGAPGGIGRAAADAPHEPGVTCAQEVVSEEEWDHGLNVKAKVILRCQAATWAKIRDGRGRNIAMDSNASTTGEPHITNYCASNFAGLDFVQAFAEELEGYCINVNCDCPVNVDIELIEQYARGYARVTRVNPELLLEEFRKEIPWGRMTRPHDVANFLASDRVEHLTGQGISVSGGAEVY